MKWDKEALDDIQQTFAQLHGENVDEESARSILDFIEGVMKYAERKYGHGEKSTERA